MKTALLANNLNQSQTFRLGGRGWVVSKATLGKRIAQGRPRGNFIQSGAQSIHPSVWHPIQPKKTSPSTQNVCIMHWQKSLDVLEPLGQHNSPFSWGVFSRIVLMTCLRSVLFSTEWEHAMLTNMEYISHNISRLHKYSYVIHSTTMKLIFNSIIY